MTGTETLGTAGSRSGTRRAPSEPSGLPLASVVRAVHEPPPGDRVPGTGPAGQ